MVCISIAKFREKVHDPPHLSKIDIFITGGEILKTKQLFTVTRRASIYHRSAFPIAVERADIYSYILDFQVVEIRFCGTTCFAVIFNLYTLKRIRISICWNPTLRLYKFAFLLFFSKWFGVIKRSWAEPSQVEPKRAKPSPSWAVPSRAASSQAKSSRAKPPT